LIVIVWPLAPCPRELGLVDSTLGAASIVKMLVPVPAPASGLVIVTLRAPVAALPATLMFAVSSVEDLNVVELTVTPLPEIVVVAPLRKCEPVTVIACSLAPCPRELGLADATVGLLVVVTDFALLFALHECQTAVTV
jgi:hypothetical protein